MQVGLQLETRCCCEVQAMSQIRLLCVVLACLLTETAAAPAGTRTSATYKRIRAYLDSIPAIDTHDHLWPFDRLPGYVETEHGRGMNLAGLWHNSYFRGIHGLTPWKPNMKFDAWWATA